MKLLDKLYEKNHLTFAIVWIVAYVVLASTADGISLDLGTEKLVTVPVLAALTALLWAWIRHAKLEGFFFLRKPLVPAARLLFYLPLVIIATKKVWLGIELGGTPVECALWVASMCCVGIIEELIITKKGSDYPYIPVTDGSCDVSIEVVPWDELKPYTETI